MISKIILILILFVVISICGAKVLDELKFPIRKPENFNVKLDLGVFLVGIVLPFQFYVSTFPISFDTKGCLKRFYREDKIYKSNQLFISIF